MVVGVQFAPPAGYSSIFARDVWNLFQESYPKVEEHPAIEPRFETFGGPQPGISLQSAIKFRFASEPMRSRLWFISPDESHLIQFQSDRLLLNWRRRPSGNNYPRFESIAESFASHLEKVQNFYASAFDKSFEINQAEVSYINIIHANGSADLDRLVSFLKIHGSVESANFQSTEIINDLDGKPWARFIIDLQSVVTLDGQSKAFSLSLTYRGKPSGNNIPDAMEFLKKGREMIVTRFTDLTTEYAHNAWGRKK